MSRGTMTKPKGNKKKGRPSGGAAKKRIAKKAPAKGRKRFTKEEVEDIEVTTVTPPVPPTPRRQSTRKRKTPEKIKFNFTLPKVTTPVQPKIESEPDSSDDDLDIPPPPFSPVDLNFGSENEEEVNQNIPETPLETNEPNPLEEDININQEPVEGITAKVNRPQDLLYVGPRSPDDGQYPSAVKVIQHFVQVPFQHLLAFQKHPLALALKSTAVVRHKLKHFENQQNRRCIEVTDQNFHLKGALEKSNKNVTKVNDHLAKKSDECDKMGTNMRLEETRFTTKWKEDDKRRIITEAEAHAKEQRYFSDRKFDEVIEVEKAKMEKRIKEIDIDRHSLVKENAQLLKRLEKSKNQAETIKKLQKRIQFLEKKRDVKNKEINCCDEKEYEEVGETLLEEDLRLRDEDEEEKMEQSDDEHGMEVVPDKELLEKKCGVKNKEINCCDEKEYEEVGGTILEEDLRLSDEDEEEKMEQSDDEHGMEVVPDKEPESELANSSRDDSNDELIFTQDENEKRQSRGRDRFSTYEIETIAIQQGLIKERTFGFDMNLSVPKDFDDSITSITEDPQVATTTNDNSITVVENEVQQGLIKERTFGFDMYLSVPKDFDDSITSITEDPQVATTTNDNSITVVENEVQQVDCKKIESVVAKTNTTNEPTKNKTDETNKGPVMSPMEVVCTNFKPRSSAIRGPAPLLVPRPTQNLVKPIGSLRKMLSAGGTKIRPVTEGKMCQKLQLEKQSSVKKVTEETEKLVKNNNVGKMHSLSDSDSSDAEKSSTKPNNQVLKKTQSTPVAKNVPDQEAGMYSSVQKPRISHAPRKPLSVSSVEPNQKPKPIKTPSSNKKPLSKLQQLRNSKQFAPTSISSQIKRPVKRASQPTVFTAARARSPPDASDSEVPLKSRRIPVLEQQHCIKKEPKKSQRRSSNKSKLLKSPDPTPSPMLPPQGYGNFPSYQPNPYFFQFGGYPPQMYGMPPPPMPDTGDKAIEPHAGAGNGGQQMPMFPPGMWPQQSPYGYPFGYPPYGNPNFPQYPTNQPLGSNQTLGAGSQPMGANQPFVPPFGGMHPFGGGIPAFGGHQPPPHQDVTPNVRNESDSGTDLETDSSSCEEEIASPLSPPPSIESHKVTGSPRKKQRLTTTGRGNVLTFSGSDWKDLKGPAGEMVIKLSKDFLDDLLQTSEDDLNNNFDRVIKNLYHKLEHMSSDAGLSMLIYEKVLQQVIAPDGPSGIFTDIEKKLMTIVMKLSTVKLSPDGPKILEKLPERLIDYLKTQVIPKRAITFALDNKGFERVGRFFGDLCGKMNPPVEIKDLIFEAMYWRPPHAFALTHGILRVNGSHYNSLEFEKFDVKDRGILFTLMRPIRFGDAKMYLHLRDVLTKSFEIKVPDWTFDQFVESILLEIRGFESSVKLQEASEVLAMFLIQGGIEWTTKFLEKSLATCIQDWRAGKVTDGVLATVFRAIGYFCRDSVEPHDLTAFKGVFAKLVKMDDQPEVIKKAVEECMNNITSKMDYIKNNKKRGVSKWEWRYFKVGGRKSGGKHKVFKKKKSTGQKK